MGRASTGMIGSLALVLIAGSFSAFIAYQKLAGRNQQIPFRVIFEGSASGLRKGGSVNFAGVRVGQVVSLTLDNPRRGYSAVSSLALVTQPWTRPGNPTSSPTLWAASGLSSAICV